MSKIAVIGAGISGITSAYSLLEAGHDIVVIDRHRYPAMETSYANGGQLSASNAEVWNSAVTILKAMRWMFRRDAPLLFNPAPSWHKYSWIAEFLWNVRNHRQNTIQTVRLAIEARKLLFSIAEREKISFDLEQRGILHICHNRDAYEAGLETNVLLFAGGLERRPVTSKEISEIEPTLKGNYHGGFFTSSDASGDIHKFTRGLAAVCAKKGANFIQDASVEGFSASQNGFKIFMSKPGRATNSLSQAAETLDIDVDRIVVCAGVESRRIASMLGDRINVYPVKGYSITVNLNESLSEQAAPKVSLLDEEAKIVTSRLGPDRFRVAGTAELNGFNRNIRQDRIDPLLTWVRSNFPGINTSETVPWAGLRPMMPSMMPVVRAGRQSGIYYNTGHGHLGWTLSAATAAMLVQIIQTGLRT